MPLSTFRLSTTPGEHQVEVDGQDVTAQVSGFELALYPGDPVASLTLHRRAGGTVEGLAQVQLAAIPDDLLQSFAQLLENLDPVELERQAINSVDLDNEPAAVTREVLRIAGRMVRGAGT